MKHSVPAAVPAKIPSFVTAFAELSLQVNVSCDFITLFSLMEQWSSCRSRLKILACNLFSRTDLVAKCKIPQQQVCDPKDHMTLNNRDLLTMKK